MLSKKQSKFNPLKKINDFIFNLRIYHYLNRRYRLIINRSKLTKTTKSTDSNLSKRFGRFNLNYRIIIPVGSIFLVLLILATHIYLFSQIKPQRFLAEDINLPIRRVEGDTLNILFAGFETRLNDYKFARMLSLISINSTNGDIKIYGLSPDFIFSTDDGNYSFKTLWNNLSQTDTLPRTTEFIDSIESFLAINIDRYVFFDTESLKSYISDNNFQLQINDNATVNGSNYKPGDIIQKQIVSNYILDNAVDRDILTLRQTNFIKTFLENNKGIFNLYRNVANFNEFSKIFRTDFTNIEYLNFLLTVNSSQIVTSNKYFLSNKFGRKADDPIETNIQPDYNLIDENLSSYFQDIDIMKEQATVEIYNGTDTTGVAGNNKRFFQNMGANVVQYGNFLKSDISETLLYIPSKNLEKYKNNIMMIKRIFRGNVKITLEDYKYNYFGDLIVVIGKDALVDNSNI